jgi:hypothetical protein
MKNQEEMSVVTGPKIDSSPRCIICDHKIVKAADLESKVVDSPTMAFTLMRSMTKYFYVYIQGTSDTYVCLKCVLKRLKKRFNKTFKTYELFKFMTCFLPRSLINKYGTVAPMYESMFGILFPAKYREVWTRKMFGNNYGIVDVEPIYEEEDRIENKRV